MSTPEEAAHEELERGRAAYSDAVALVKSPKWGVFQAAALARISEVVRPFDGDANKAAFYLGQVKEALRPIEAPLKTIRDFEASRKSLEELKG